MYIQTGMLEIEDDTITGSQKTYFEVGLSCIGCTIICGNVFVLVTMYRLVRLSFY